MYKVLLVLGIYFSLGATLEGQVGEVNNFLDFVYYSVGYAVALFQSGFNMIPGYGLRQMSEAWAADKIKDGP